MDTRSYNTGENSEVSTQIVGNFRIEDFHSHRIARMGDRVVAVFLDGIILFPYFWLSIAFVAVCFDSYDKLQGSATLTGGPALLSMVIFVVIWLGYHTIGEGWFAGTLGKHVMGIEVRSTSRRPSLPSQVILRNLLRPVDVIGFYLLGFLVAVSSKTGQRIGDFAAQTVVCERETTNRLTAALWWIGSITFGLSIDSIFIHFARQP